MPWTALYCWLITWATLDPLGFWRVAEVRDQVSSYEEVTQADCQSWPLTPWVRWWAWGRDEVEVEDRERSQIFCASVLPNILELLSNQQVNVERWDHQAGPNLGLVINVSWKKLRMLLKPLGSQWCWEYQSAGCAPPTQEGFPFAPRFILPHLPSPLILVASNGLDPEKLYI